MVYTIVVAVIYYRQVIVRFHLYTGVIFYV